MRKMREGRVRAINVAELVGELATSAFAGILTFWACEATGVPPLWSAVCVGISGHFGTRTVFLMEQMLITRLGKKG